MKWIRTVIVIILVTTVILGAKFLFFPSKKTVKPSGTKTGPPPVNLVSVFVANTSDQGDQIYASGSILANEEADLHPEISGRIEYLNLPEGKSVSKGTLLLKINDDDIQAQLNKIRSQIKLARESEIRQKKLLDIEGASQQEYEQAQANLNALKADSEYYRAQIAKTEIHAPFNGIVGIRQISLGSFVTPTSIITTISQTNPVKIDFYLPERYSSLLSAGDKISFTIEETTTRFDAKITVKDPKIDVVNRSIRFRAMCNNQKGFLIPGSFVKIKLRLKGNKNSIFIPTDAAIPTLKGKKVFIVKNGKAEEKEIETGLRTAENIQILSGLNEGDSVIVTGNYQLKAGASVKVAKKKIDSKSLN